MERLTTSPQFHYIMKLLTEKQKQTIAEKYPLRSQDNKQGNAVCVAKFFMDGWTWYILEGSFEDGDFMMFGVVVNAWGNEYGYISFNELQNLTVYVNTPIGKLPVKVERDLYFKPTRLENIDDKELKKFLHRLYDREEVMAEKTAIEN